jgi:uncharacterized membrane protein YkvA (DUF1232 family)
MEWWQLVLIAVVTALVVLALAAFLLWRNASERTRALGERIEKLSWRARFRLAWRLVWDPRIPILVRAILPVLVFYLAMPLDIIPDFIPVLGQLDDLLVVLVAFGLLARFVPMTVIDSIIASIEDEERQDEAESV